MGQRLWQATKFAVRLAKFAVMPPALLCLAQDGEGCAALPVQLEGTSGGPGTEVEPCKGGTRYPRSDSVTHVLQHPAGQEQ